MLCPVCQKENPVKARFCIFCGSPIPTSESESTQEQSQIMKNEISQLREMLKQVSTRLDALEGKTGLATAPPPISAIPAEIKSEAIEEIPKAIPAGAEAEKPSEEPAAVTAMEKPAPREPREWEQILGGNWLARIGVLALIIGVGFFLKYAFDNNWIGPAVRIIIGVAGGLIMLSLGYWWRKRYPIMTQVLSGGGISIIYLSIFASFATYHLVSIYIAVFLLLVTSIVSTVLALRYDSMALAIIGIFGAFFAPFILGAFEHNIIKSESNGNAVQLLVYIIVINIGVLLLSNFRSWRWFTLLALGCTLITYGAWYGQFHRNIGVSTAEIGVTVLFLLFVGATTIFHAIRRRMPQAFDYLLMLITAGAYFGASMGLMWHPFRAWMGGFVLLLAIFYGGLAYIVNRRGKENSLLSLFALGTAIVFFTVAIPIQFKDQAWTTVAFAAEGAVLVWLTFRARMLIFHFFSYAAFFCVVIRLLAFDTWTSRSGIMPIFNERFLAFIIAIAAMWAAAFLFWKNRKNDFNVEHSVMVGAVNFFTIWLIGAEIITYSGQVMTTAHSLSLIILLLLAGATILNLLIWRRKPQVLDIVLMLFNTVSLIIISIFIWHDLRAWIGATYFLLALFFGLLTYHGYSRGSEGIRLRHFAMAVTVVFFTAAFEIQLGDVAWTTIAWTAEFVLMIWLSFKTGLASFRNFSYAVFLAMCWRLLIFDTTINIRAFTPFLNQRFLAFVISIAATYLAIYILWKHRESFPEWHAPASTFAGFASFFTIWILSFEVWQSFSNPIHNAMPSAKTGLYNAQNLSLTGVWAIYSIAGLAVGIRKHWRAVRIGSLAFLAVPIIKVFVYDVFKLQTSYRIGAFIGLGLLLLIGAYLYQRYSKIIKGVFTGK